MARIPGVSSAVSEVAAGGHLERQADGGQSARRAAAAAPSRPSCRAWYSRPTTAPCHQHESRGNFPTHGGFIGSSTPYALPHSRGVTIGSRREMRASISITAADSTLRSARTGWSFASPPPDAVSSAVNADGAPSVNGPSPPDPGRAAIYSNYGTSSCGVAPGGNYAVRMERHVGCLYLGESRTTLLPLRGSRSPAGTRRHSHTIRGFATTDLQSSGLRHECGLAACRRLAALLVEDSRNPGQNSQRIQQTAESLGKPGPSALWQEIERPASAGL